MGEKKYEKGQFPPKIKHSLKMENDGSQVHHQHKSRKEGRGSKEKKKDKRQKAQNTRVERHNNRAFSVANVGRTKRNIQRNADREQQKEYVPLNDRRAAEVHETPPALIVVMGPPGVGKSTLIRYAFLELAVDVWSLVFIPALTHM